MAKKKLPRLNEESYARYEDGRFTFCMGIEDSRSKRYIKEGKDLMVSHNEGYTIVVGPLNLGDLKALRKIIRKAIRNYESNEPLQI